MTMTGIPNLKHQGVYLDSLEGASSKEELLKSQLFVPSGTPRRCSLQTRPSMTPESSGSATSSVSPHGEVLEEEMKSTDRLEQWTLPTLHLGGSPAASLCSKRFVPKGLAIEEAAF